MIDQTTIDKVIDTAKIEEVVGEEVDLRKRGVNLLGLCPFHNEKTPSFTVSPAKGIFKCFGCGEAGDSVGFMMKYHRINFLDAIKQLANKYHIEVEEEEETPEAAQRRKDREARQLILTWTQGFYHQELKKMQSSAAHPRFQPFLHQWGISSDIIDTFQIGLSLSQGDTLVKAISSKGYKKEIVEATALTVSDGQNSKDFFRNHIIFPILTVAGRVAGFSGIKINEMDSSYGFIMLSESPSFQPEKEILGIYQAKGDILKKKGCHLTMHPLEMIYLYQNQLYNSVSIPRNILSGQHIKQIVRFSNNITLWSGDDIASIMETYNRISKLIHEGVSVKVVDINTPHLVSYLQEQRISSFEEHVAQAKDWLFYLVKTLYKNKDTLGLDNSSVFMKIIQVIHVIPDAIVKGVYVTELSKHINLPEDMIWGELQNMGTI
ncbi:CHC2 zinc finger domain-containing protein [Prolixibacteraceae bacterium]|nr:CHC2 zinc finger domain-containing protein [Prolixibacteraceae bacterium]